MVISKTECISVFNAMIRGTPVSFVENLLPMVVEYLTEIKYEKSDLIINLIVQNPQLIELTIPKIEEYFCRKYYIFKLMSRKGSNINQTILYYG